MKIKKISVLVLGCIFALAAIINQILSYVLVFILNLFPSFMDYLGGNIVLARTAGIVLLILIGFLLGVLLALAYNLMAKCKKCQLILETDNKG